LDVKKEKIRLLKDLNTQAEKMKSYMEPITVDFQRRYAGVVLDLDKLNKDLNEYLVEVQQYCLELAPEQGLSPSVSTLPSRNKCEDEAREIVSQTNRKRRNVVKDDRVVELVTQLTSLMLQVKSFAESDLNTFEFKCLNDAMTDVKNSLGPSNVNVFQNNVEIHVKHIQSGLSQLGNLHAFAAQPNNSQHR
jgi:hypothetical protein